MHTPLITSFSPQFAKKSWQIVNIEKNVYSQKKDKRFSGEFSSDQSVMFWNFAQWNIS